MSLTTHQAAQATEYNRRRLGTRLARLVRGRLGLTGESVDDGLAHAVAEWQQAHLPRSRPDGKVGPETEAHLDIQHPDALRAARAAERIQRGGGILFDSWGNDFRDNDLDGLVDERDEQTWDGAHSGRTYGGFGVAPGVYHGGWSFRPGTVTVARRSVITGRIRYAVCADVVSEAYAAAHVMPHLGSTRRIMAQLRRKGILWRRSESYPSAYLPGDFICTWAPGGGHSGIVVERSDTNGGRRSPVVVELPGPSSQVSDGTYDPAADNDVVRHRWSSWRITGLSPEVQYLGRLLLSRFESPR